MKIPKINIKKPEKKTKAEKPKKQEVAEKGESILASFEVSESTVRKVWAGEIAIASVVSLIAVLIAFLG